ncbi:hypothetical protein E3U43_005807 [Larimichthys crocea]|uniref:Uncharacterized protein n=1 Tax=Larimichthys crocea TaxID=215358 RepID=A0ACD3QMK5_LARCR|nr:hypothetical protein E3U43_005807 [Larimichthys crocea]
MAIAFILQPSKEEPVNSPNNHRCQVESLQSIRKVLLRALNLQVEPQLPASGLDRFREQWSGNFIDADRKAKDTAEVNTVQCVQNPDAQVTCCQPTSQKMVPVLYMDELATLTISSMQLTNSCGCGYGNIQQPSEE